MRCDRERIRPVAASTVRAIRDGGLTRAAGRIIFRPYPLDEGRLRRRLGMERGAASAGLGLAALAVGGTRDRLASTMTAPRPVPAQTAAAGASSSACYSQYPPPGRSIPAGAPEAPATPRLLTAGRNRKDGSPCPCRARGRSSLPVPTPSASFRRKPESITDGEACSSQHQAERLAMDPGFRRGDGEGATAGASHA
jgi:hypothetical protein